MGVVFENLTMEELCDLMCGEPEEEPEEEQEDAEDDESGGTARSADA